jgi:uncharacterized protein (TIGR03435 family)
MSKLACFSKKVRRSILGLSMVMLSALAFGQASSPLSFEVASIKPAEQLTPAMIAAGKLHVGLKIDSARMDIGYLSLADLIPFAFKLQPYQVSGPDWLKGSQRFDIMAKLPEGSTKEQVPEMMQSLLSERFHLKYHRETRDLPIYTLVVSKGGHKLKEAAPDAVALAEPPKEGAKDDAAATADMGKIEMKPNQGGGARIAIANGAMNISVDPDGQIHLEVAKITMEQFAALLSQFAGKPVFDKTELKGSFQVTLNLTIEDLMPLVRASGVNLPLPALSAPGNASDPSGGSSITSSVKQLGLSLEPQKAPTEFLVVDQLEKMPTEN